MLLFCIVADSPEDGLVSEGTTRSTDEPYEAEASEPAAADTSLELAVDNQPLPTSAKGLRRRSGRAWKKLKDFVPKPRGAPGGPLRTPLHIGDTWQHQESYEVEKVSSFRCRHCFIHNSCV